MRNILVLSSDLEKQNLDSVSDVLAIIWIAKTEDFHAIFVIYQTPIQVFLPFFDQSLQCLDTSYLGCLVTDWTQRELNFYNNFM